MSKKQFPLYDLATPVLRGERWVDMKGFRGFYQVSSHGRIRSMERKVESRNRWNQLLKVTKPGVIRKQKLRIMPNEFAGTPHYDCGISLWKGNSETTLRISRIVYEHFVGKLNGLKVVHKDGDGRNNHYRNLLATTDSEVRRIAYANGRQRSGFATMSKARLKKIHKILSLKGMQPVQRVSETGRVLKNFASIYDAAKDAPCDRNYMTHVLKGRRSHVKGKFYRYKPD